MANKAKAFVRELFLLTLASRVCQKKKKRKKASAMHVWFETEYKLYETHFAIRQQGPLGMTSF